MPSLLSPLLLLLLALPLAGCEAKACAQMRQCCKVMAQVDGMGQACGALAEGTKDPATCKSVTQTVRFMLADRKMPLPKACEAAASAP